MNLRDSRAASRGSFLDVGRSFKLIAFAALSGGKIFSAPNTRQAFDIKALPENEGNIPLDFPARFCVIVGPQLIDEANHMHTITTTADAATTAPRLAAALEHRLAAVHSEIEATPAADLDDDHPLFTERFDIIDLIEALPADTFAALAAKAAAYRSINRDDLQGGATDERLLIQIFDALMALAVDCADGLAVAA